MALPGLVFLLFGGFDDPATFEALTLQGVVQNLVGAAISALGIGISVFATGELSDRTNLLAETFA
jgi:hypothetical protein